MKLKHLFLTFSFVVGIFSVAFAQQQQTALNVATTSTSDTLDFAGREQARFVTNIANTATDGSSIFIDNMQLELPDGFELISMQLKKGETTLVSNSTSMQLNDTLKVMESYTLDYTVRPTCNAIPTNVSNQFSILRSNTLNINYTEHDTIKSLGFQTNSYRLEIPNLYLNIGRTSQNNNYHDNVKEIFWQEYVTDTFTIKNTEGAGAISNMRVSMWLMQNQDAFSDIKFIIANQEYVPTNADGMYSIDLTSSDFQNAGLGNTFNGGENLNVVVSFKPTKFYLQTQVKYIARVKNGSDICNEQTNASAVRNYQCKEPDVNLRATMNIIQQANYCGRDFICDVTFTNTSENVITNTLTNAELAFSNSGYQIISVQHNGTDLAPSSYRRYPLPTNDANGDNIPDLQPQESCTLRITARPSAPTSNVSFWVDLTGYTIDGSYMEESCVASSSLSVQNFSILSPSDSRGGDTATYHVDIDLQANHYFQQRERGFLDVDFVGLMYDEVIEEFNINRQNFSYSNNISIIASCDKPQLFKIVVRTNECDVLYTKATQTGNSIVECPDSLYGSDCISIRTIDVSPITPQQINTCETFTINATGELAYWCTDTCSNPQKIMAYVYDLDENLQFESVACSISVNGSSYNIQPSSEIAIGNGIAWTTDIIQSFPCSDTLNKIPLQLTAQVFIRGNHNLPNMSNHNIRVVFSAEDDENAIHIANSKGSILTVYDPEVLPYAYSFPSSVEGNVTVSLSMTQAAASASQHPIRLTHVDLPAVEGYYYTTTSEVGRPFSMDIPDAIAYNTPNGSQNAEFTQRVRALCIIDGTPYNGTIHGTYTYTDYYASCKDNDTFTKDFAKVYSLDAPVIEMDSSMEQGLTKFTTWNVFVKNTGNADAPNVTLRIKPNENNVTNLNIISISVNDHVVLDSDFKTIDGITYVKIGTINESQNRPVRVTVTMSGCSADGFSYLDVTAIWTCEDIIPKENIAEEFELRNCNNFFTRLKLENMKAELSAQETYSTQKFKLCQDIPIHLDIYNSGRANLTNVGFAIEKSSLDTRNGIYLVDNSISTTYDLNQKSISDQVILLDSTMFYNTTDTSYAVLSDLVLLGEDLPSQTSNENIIGVDFSVRAICSNNTVIKPIRFKAFALTNCGEPQEQQFIYYLPLEGLDQIRMVGVTASSTQFTALQSGGIAEGQIVVTVTNTSTEPLKNFSVNINLPDGLVVTTQSGTPQINGFTIETSQNSYGATSVTLNAPSGYSLQPNSACTFTLTLQENKLCPQQASKALIYVNMPARIASACGTDIDSCDVSVQTNEFDVELKRMQQPVTITITGADTVCVGNEVTLTASGADSYQWNTGSTNAITEVTYPTTTYHVTGTTSDGCSGEAEHTITFIERLTQPQLVLVVGSDTVTNGKIQYSDWSTLGEQIIHPITDTEGILTQINQPNDGGCGTYEYQYTITTQCDSLAASITFEVENCDTTTCEDGDLVVIEGKTGYTLEDLEVLRSYVQNGATLQPTTDGGFTITIETNCGERTYTLNSCFINNADINKDGVVNNADIDRLAELILEQTNCQNNQNN